MRSGQVVGMSAGAVSIYLVMAACGGVDGSGLLASAIRDAGGDAASSPDDGGSLLDALVDAIAHPVKDASADGESGSRLKARRLVGEDGSSSLIGWRDTKRNEDCGFATAADGVQRCIPLPPIGLSEYFLDAGCTARVVSRPYTCSPVTGAYALASDYKPNACGTAEVRYHLYTIGAQVTPATLFQGSPANCVANNNVPSDHTYFAVAGEVDPTNFVAATIKVDQ